MLLFNSLKHSLERHAEWPLGSSFSGSGGVSLPLVQAFQIRSGAMVDVKVRTEKQLCSSHLSVFGRGRIFCFLESIFKFVL